MATWDSVKPIQALGLDNGIAKTNEGQKKHMQSHLRIDLSSYLLDNLSYLPDPPVREIFLGV